MSKLGRAFEGWQAGLVVIVTSVLVALVVVPRPVLPDEIPLPPLDPGALRQIVQQDADRGVAAEREPLPFEIRAVGEAFREIGSAAAAEDRETVKRMRYTIEVRARAAAREQPAFLLQLRAYQTRVFLRELAAFEASGQESQELREVGGDFIRSARAAGWIRTRHGRPRLIADERVRFVLFRKRWNDITKLHVPPFKLSLHEERAFHAFLFDHPVISVPASHRRDVRTRCRAANEYLLRRVDSYGLIDRAYPTDYARGILLLRLGRDQAALQPLLRFIENNPDGPYALRARNALRHAHDRVHGMLAE